MSREQEEMRRAVREMSRELVRTAEQAGRLALGAADDVARWVGEPMSVIGSGGDPDRDPIELIRRLGQLRDDGFITDEEFQAKKRRLLAEI